MYMLGMFLGKDDKKGPTSTTIYYDIQQRMTTLIDQRMETYKNEIEMNNKLAADTAIQGAWEVIKLS